MSKHTPGPWAVAATHSQCEVVNAYPEAGKAWELQATATSPANARLIAAAPDLLAWAKRSQFLLTGFRELNDEQRKQVYAELDAAIAKAEGRE